MKISLPNLNDMNDHMSQKKKVLTGVPLLLLKFPRDRTDYNAALYFEGFMVQQIVDATNDFNNHFYI